MKPDQYQIPTELVNDVESVFVGIEDSETYDGIVAGVESAFVDVSLDPQSAEYVFIQTQIKGIQAKLDLLRASASEENLPKRTALEQALESLKNVLASRSQRSLRDRLIEAESEASRKLFVGEPGVVSQRFWYDQNDWLYEITDASGTMVALYKFEDDGSYKLVDGRSIAFAPGEEAALVETINRYYALVQIELYSNKADWVPAA